MLRSVLSFHFTKRFAFNTLVGRVLCFLSKKVPNLISISVKVDAGYWMKLNARDKTSQLACREAYGDVVPNALRILRPQDVFIDIGANAGTWTLYARTNCNKDGFAIAIEPSPVAFADLIDNLRTNLLDRVVPLNFALGTVGGVMALTTEKGHSGKSHISENGSPIVVMAGSILVDLVSALHRNSCSSSILPRIGIKIDVEGYELIVLRGLSDLLDAFDVCFVVVEIDDSYLSRFSSTSDQIYAILASRGFTATVAPGLPRPDHFDEVFIREGSAV